MYDQLLQGATAKSLALSRILYFESQMHRRMGIVRPQRYIRLWNYYAGTNLPPNNVEQPLDLNYFKAVCDKHTSYLFGEYSEHVIDWAVRPLDTAKPEDRTGIDMRRWLQQLCWLNKGNKLFWNGALNGAVYGDTVFRLRWDVLEERVVIENILPEYFHCRWMTQDMTKLTEAVVAWPVDRFDAWEQFGTFGNPSINYNIINPEYQPGMGIYWEHWTTHRYQIWIDDMLVVDHPNPYMWQDQQGHIYPGIIPFVHIPNMQVGGEFYGFGDAEGICLLQDEINRRLADQGDIVNNHAHPIVTLNKFHGDVEDLPVGPDAVWNLGLDGKAEILEAKGNPMVMEYVGQLMQSLQDTASIPEIAFGRSTRAAGRSQTSATAIQLILMPVVERARRKRIEWSEGLRTLANIAMFIQEVYAPGSLPFRLEDVPRYMIVPQFGPILPRDRLQLVNENTSLVIAGLKSIARALEDLGEKDIAEEMAQIQKELVWRAKLAGAGVRTTGKNSDKGAGGSNQLPGGPSGPMLQPGAPAKDPGNPGTTNPALASFQS
jgi:hypothetical protein